MAKKTKNAKASRRYPEDWTNEEWENWGQRFGRRMEHFGKRLGERMGAHGKDFEAEVNSRFECCCRPFSWFGPLIGAIFTTVLIAIGASVAGYISFVTGSAFIAAIAAFFMLNLPLFFVVSLATGYIDHFAKAARLRWLLWPVSMAINVMFAFWVILSIISLIPAMALNSVVAKVTSAFYSDVWAWFTAIAAIGYVMILFSRMTCPAGTIKKNAKE